MQTGRPHHGHDRGDRTGQHLQKVERVYGLIDHHAAAITRICTATGLIVIALWTPPGNIDLGTGKLPEAVSGNYLLQFHRRFPEAVLKDHAKGDFTRFGYLDELSCTDTVTFKWLFQQHVLARGRCLRHECAPRIRRRKDNHGPDLTVAP